MSVARAEFYVDRMVRLETVSAGSKQAAIDGLARRYGLTPSQLSHLLKRRAKGCDIGLFCRIECAYLDLCTKFATALCHELRLEKAISGDASDQDLLDMADSLAAEARARKAARQAAKGQGR